MVNRFPGSAVSTVPPDLYELVAPCDDEPVTLEEYDALLREWLREEFSKFEGGVGELSRKSGLAKSDLSNALNRRAKRRRNVSKDMFVSLVGALGVTMTGAFHRLSVLADRYERGDLRLDIAPADGGITVRKEHAAKTRAVATEVSKRSAGAKKKSTPAPTRQPSEATEGPSPRKS